MRESEATKIVAYLMAAFPRAPVTKQTAAVYAESLEDLEHDEAWRAVRRIVSTEDNPYSLPTIGRIRKAVTGAGVEGKIGELAWGSVLKAVSRVGIYGSPSFEDALTEIAVSQIGWRDICNSDTRGLSFLRTSFVKAYNAARDRIVVEGSAKRLESHVDHKRLSGLHDRDAREPTRGPVLLSNAIADVVNGE